ncbi:hypothetical protein C8F01DRAFT_266898 [Mycena amicta]|nr:hypothetical protein C8F01DRAFT_266898 [Mycena amicta]
MLRLSFRVGSAATKPCLASRVHLRAASRVASLTTTTPTSNASRRTWSRGELLGRQSRRGLSSNTPTGDETAESLSAAGEESASAAGRESVSVPVAPVGARSIYIWKLHPHTSLEDLRTLAPADVVENIRHWHEPKNRCAVITFVDPVAALMFFQTSVSLGLRLKGYRQKLGWAKVYNNSPNVIMENIQDFKVFNEERLRADFGEFGVVYSVNLHEKTKTAVVKFTNIPDARNAIQTMKPRPEYSPLKLRHAGDSALPSPTVFIGFAKGLEAPFTEEQLRADFGEFGTIDHIWFSEDKSRVLVHFTDMLSAAKALNAIHTRPEYAGVRLRFGQDEFRTYNGPTPDVYIGPIKDSEIFTQQRLKADLSKFGSLRSVKILPARECAIVEFENTADTIRAIEDLKTRPEYADLEVRHARVPLVTLNEVRAKQKTLASANESGKAVERGVTGKKPPRKASI